MGKHTVDHMQQGPIQCAQQNNQTRHKNYAFKKESGSEVKGKDWNLECFLIEVSEYKFV